MLTLLEPPGRKKGHQRHRSAQQLLNFALDDEDFDVASENGGAARQASQRPAQGCATRFLDKHLVWKSNSADANEKWRKEFRVRPSWCDADLCLQQIKRGRASGNLWALYSRSFIQKLLFWLGNAVANNALFVLITICIAFAFCCNGLRYVHIETDIVKLWVSKGGRLDEELNFLDRIKANHSYNSSNEASEIVRENGLGGGYQVLIQTPESPGQNALSREALLKHVRVMEQIATLKVNVHGVDWSLADICFKPAPPQIANDSIASLAIDVIDRIVPCIWITPIDCFWEGSKALGPHPYLQKGDLGPMVALMNSLPQGSEIRWSDFDPQAVIDEVHNIFGLGSHYTFFKRTGLGHGYMDRPCIDPLDPDCPISAPNYFDVCPLVDTVLQYTKTKLNITLHQEAEKNDWDFIDFLGDFASRRKRDVQNAAAGQQTAPLKQPINQAEELKKKEAAEKEQKAKEEKQKKKCTSYRRSVMNWLSANRDKWADVPIPEQQRPSIVNYGEQMTHGCAGFARGVLHWPEDMILGGAKRIQHGPLTHADALQSVFLVASPQDVYLRFKEKPGRSLMKPSLNQSSWNTSIAEEVLQTWQRNFTRTIYDHKDNVDAQGNERRTLHPLASTSIADMLQEFCDFDYGVIFFGYFLMLLYALWTQMRFDSCLPSSESFMGLALAGILVVTFSSVAGLGTATWFGIEFNAATTQIVPFLSLGIGVDNMFMLLHNYADLTRLASRDEMGILMRETGMTLLCTSTNNILSFLAGTMLPIPALRSFCAQISILLTFNFIAICTLYPAILSIDLRRRRAGRRDILCCLYGKTPDDTYSIITKPKDVMPMKRTLGDNSVSSMVVETSAVNPDEDLNEVPPHSLRGYIRNYYIPFISNPIVKGLVVILSLGLIGLSIVGAMNASLGLELSDVLPEHTAPAQFLRARDKYFSFYPMFAVLQGPNIDYARQQRQIENYRNMIGTSPFVIKSAAGEPSEKYWLGLMRDWLVSIQKGVDEAIEIGSFDPVSGKIISKNISDDALIGHSLLCSIGSTYNCTGRVGRVSLVDKHGIIRPDGFYNYLTAWYNEDHMMYYVSQASFYPVPPKWEFDNVSIFVPPAEPLAYSQIPFYLTGLTDTNTIVKMIHDIRSICERFADHNLPNFPSGIAFTFWEQYLSLWANLMRALSLITLAVFIVISVLLFNPWAAANVVLMLIVMTIELAGFMGWAGIKLNPVSAVTLITAVGIGVEFTVHVAFSFLTSVGSREQRSSFAVDRVFVPVIHGSFSTLLGILMLGFSDFEFVFKYFFVIMSALIVVGAINGLILLPVTLSWFGPPSEITPLHGKTTLVLPPPLEMEEAEEC